jgi:hypothetical protein
LRQTGEWFELWCGSPTVSMGSKYGYSQQDIDNAVSSLKRVYDPEWVQANPGHPIVISLFGPESELGFLQVVDLGYAIASFPPLLEGDRGNGVIGRLRSAQGFYPTEYEIRVLSRLNKIVDSLVLEEKIPRGPNAARPDAQIQHNGRTVDIEIFRKDWSSYIKEAFHELAANGTPVDPDETSLREWKRLEQEVYERLDKVDKTTPMVFICSPPPHLMILFELNRANDKTYVDRVVSEVFRSVHSRASDCGRDRLQRVSKLVVDMPDLVLRHTSDNHKGNPSEFICCTNPYFVP